MTPPPDFDHALVSAMLAAAFALLATRSPRAFHTVLMTQTAILAIDAILLALLGAGPFVAAGGVICAAATATPQIAWSIRRRAGPADDDGAPAGGPHMIAAALAGSAIVLIALVTVIPLGMAGLTAAHEIPAMGVALCLLSMLVIVSRPHPDIWAGGLLAFANGLSVAALHAPALLPSTVLIVAAMAIAIWRQSRPLPLDGVP